jgi:DNA replication and repair protein RecF
MEGKGELVDFANLFRERLAVRLQAEATAGHALIGPHRDDLEILADGREVARFGSAGQQRSALLLLDLAQVSIYNSIYEESPVLLIDDIDAELDRGRIEALLSVLEGRAQTFVSTSRRAIANRYRDRAEVFYVERGRAGSEGRSEEGVEAVTAAGSEQARDERKVIIGPREEGAGPAEDRGDHEQSIEASFK